MGWEVCSFLLVVLVFASGCIESAVQLNNGNGGNTVLPVDQSPPTISQSRADPTNPSVGDTIEVTVSAQDNVGIARIVLEASPAVENGSSASFDCEGQTSCNALFELVPSQQGAGTLIIFAVDTSNNESVKTRYVLNVGAAAGPSPLRCGNGTCESTETNASCPQDCSAPVIGCADGVCNPGESYNSCPQDCGIVDGIGRVCGDGACESGEDAQACPGDCATINPACGNNVCDSGETQANCSADCKPVVPTDECSSNSDCDSRQVCNSGKCFDVECTNSAQCGSCERCSSNSCRSCGSGPYGCYC